MSRKKTIFIIFAVLIPCYAVLSVHQASSCRCKCSRSYENVFKDCLNSFKSCRVISCTPYPLGFACCEGGSIPFADKESRRRAQEQLAHIERTSQTAASKAKERSKKATEILDRCKQRVQKIGKRHFLYRMSSRKSINLRLFQRWASNVYVASRKGYLQYVSSKLKKHIK